jgi:catecholate siderophore receptor
MASWQVSDRVGLRLNLQNLTDETYYTRAYPVHFAMPAPGRSVLLSANIDF